MAKLKAAIMGTLASVFCAFLLLSAAVARAEERAPQAFDISPQSLASALSEFARQSQTEILFAPDIVSDRETHGVRGTLQPLDALSQLLHDTGLTFVTTPQGAILVQNRRSAAGSAAIRLAQSDTAQPDSSPGNSENVPPSSTDDKAAAALEEIIVTAERREESAQGVPISMSVFSRDFIKEHIRDVFDLTDFTPNFQIESHQGFHQSSFASIRGLSTDVSGAQDSTSILTYYDGIAMGTPFAATLPLWDLDRIEVQRGPQGTLYGRNAVAGAVQYFSAAPTEEFEGYGELSLGEFDLRRFEGALSGPITDNVKARLSALTYDRGGDVENTFLDTKQGEKDWWGVRGILDWQISTDFAARVKTQYFEGDQDILFFNAASSDVFAPSVLAWFDAAGQDPDLSRESNFERYQSVVQDPFESFETKLVELDLNYDFGPLALTAIGGYVDGKDRFIDDPLSFAAQANTQGGTSDFKQWSGELRLTSQTEHPLQWIGGAYFQHTADSTEFFVDLSALIRDFDGDGLTRHNADSPEDLLDGINPVIPGVSNVVYSGGGMDQELESYAFFAHTTYDWTDRLTTTHAVRYTHEEKTVNAGFLSLFEFPVSPGITPGTPEQFDDLLRFVSLSDAQQRQQALSIISDPNTLDASGNIVPDSASDAWDELTWRFAAEYRFAAEAMIYTSISKGFKGGGFGLAGSGVGIAPFDPETSIVYEVGTKTQWWDDRLQVNVSGFYNDHTNFQTLLAVLGPGGVTLFSLENLPKSELYGGEIEIKVLPVKNLLVAANLGMVETEITEVLSGNEALLGNELPRAEDMNFSGLVRYDALTSLGTFSPQLSGRYRGEYWSKKENDDITGKLGGFWTADLRLGYESPSGKLYGAFFVKNLFDEVQPILSLIPQPQGAGSTLSKINERRTWGITAGYRF